MILTNTVKLLTTSASAKILSLSKSLQNKVPVIALQYLDDVKNLDFDVLLEGLPCQVFSIAGDREGFRDSKNRGDLFFYATELLKKTQLKALLLKNVKNLQSHDKGKAYQIIKESLQNLGY